MGELEEKLEGILGNPDAMAQIMSLAQSLNLNGAGGSGGPPPAAGPAEKSESPPPPPAPSGGGGALAGLSALDPKILSAAASLLGQYQDGEDDRRVALLKALRPFVKEQRYAKLDKAIQIAKLSRLIRSALDLFRAAKEDGNV